MLTLVGLFVCCFFSLLAPQITIADSPALTVTDVPLFLWTLPNMLFPGNGKVADKIGNLPYHVPSRRSVKPNEAKKESTTASPTTSTAASTTTASTPSEASSSETSTMEALMPEERASSEEIADNTVMYLKMAVYVIKAHAMCFYKIAKLTMDHIKKYLKLIVTNPLQILMLPFTLPLSSVKVLLSALKLFVQVIVTLILK